MKQSALSTIARVCYVYGGSIALAPGRVKSNGRKRIVKGLEEEGEQAILQSQVKHLEMLSLGGGSRKASLPRLPDLGLQVKKHLGNFALKESGFCGCGFAWAG